MSIHPYIRPSVRPSVCWSIHPSICPSVHPPPEASQASNSHWITWEIDKIQTSHWITWKIYKKVKNFMFPIEYHRSLMKIEKNVKFPLDKIVNRGEIEKMKNSYWITWKVATKASNMPSQGLWKFTPVSYRTLALWGCCPALTPILQLITPSRASGTADHVRSLDD